MSFFVGHPAVVGKPGDIHTSALNPLGMEALGSDGIKYVYLKGVASTIAGSVVTYDTAGESALIAADAIGPVAIASAATVASTWGWYVRNTNHATCDINMAANSAASGHVGREGADGAVGDGRAAGDEIRGLVAPASTSAAVYSGARIFDAYVDNSTGA